MKNQIKILCGAVALMMAGQVSAVTTWTFSSGSDATQAAFTVSGVGTTAINSTATGFANTGSGSSVATYTLEAQLLTRYSGNGLGMTNKDACGTSPCDSYESSVPEHALDNNQRNEMVLLDFGSALVNLSSAKFGWTGTTNNNATAPKVTDKDSDYTVLAYQGDGSASSKTLAGKTWATLGTGWLNVGLANVNNHDGVATGATAGIGLNIYSSLWLIGPYNSLIKTAADAGSLVDSLKLQSISGCVKTDTDISCNPPGKVPEPGSLALLGLGILGLVGMRRNRKH